MPKLSEITDFNTLRQVIHAIPELEIVVLVGSRARGDAGAHSDWDIAVRWASSPADFTGELARTEDLRRQLADILNTDVDRVDLIDLSRANLAMRAVVAEEGIVLKGDDDLPWFHFLARTWRELEDWYWEQEHAA